MTRTQRKELDALWTLKIKQRANNKCEKCGATMYLQGHHIIPRTNYRLRWDMENGVCLCRAHHLYWAHKDALDFMLWVSKIRNIDYLHMTRNQIQKQDYFLVKQYLESTLFAIRVEK